MAVAFDEMAAAVQSREERIQRSEEHLAHAQHVAAIGSFEYSFKSGAREWSAETFDLLGINPASGLPSQTTLEKWSPRRTGSASTIISLRHWLAKHRLPRNLNSAGRTAPFARSRSIPKSCSTMEASRRS